MSAEIPICSTEAVTKSYDNFEVLHGIDLEIGSGEITVISGQSGSGKSTLMNCMAGLEVPTSGRVMHEGVDIHDLSDKALFEWRARNIGFVFQAANLLGGVDVRQNIINPHKVNRTLLDTSWLFELTDTLGITSELSKFPRQLSGGQKQRVAIARALAHRPAIVFADEPTASLDRVNREEVYGLFRSLVDISGVTVVMVAHDDVAVSSDYADRVIELSDGHMSGDSSNGKKAKSLFSY